MARAIFVDELPGWVMRWLEEIPVDPTLPEPALRAAALDDASSPEPTSPPFGSFQPLGPCFWQYLRVTRLVRVASSAFARVERHFVWFELDNAKGMPRPVGSPGDRQTGVPPWISPERRPTVPPGILELVSSPDRLPVFLARCTLG